MSWGRSCILILAAALVIRLAAGIYWQQRLPQNQFFALPDSESYWVLGKAIAEGKPYQYGGPETRVFRAPGYPLLLAGIFAICPSDQRALYTTRGVGAVLGVLCVALVMLWSVQLFDRRAALVAAVLMSLYPGAIASSILILSEMLFCPLMLGHLVAWTAADRPHDRFARWGFAALAGVLAGAATLTRPSWLLFAPFAGLGSVALSKNKFQRLTSLVVLLFAMCATMLPWWIRNYRVTGHFVPTTLQVGASLYDGLNPKATGASDMGFTREFFESLKKDQKAGRLPPGSCFEYELDQRLRSAAKNWAQNHPSQVLHLAFVKFARLWNFWPNDPAFRNPIVRWSVALSYTPLLLLGLAGAVRFAPRGELYCLALLPAVYLTALHVIFVSSMRYREPAMFALIVLASGALTALPAALRKHPAELAH